MHAFNGRQKGPFDIYRNKELIIAYSVLRFSTLIILSSSEMLVNGFIQFDMLKQSVSMAFTDTVRSDT